MKGEPSEASYLDNFNADCLVVVFDITKKRGFDEAKQRVLETLLVLPDMPIMMLATFVDKISFASPPCVSELEWLSFCRSVGVFAAFDSGFHYSQEQIDAPMLHLINQLEALSGHFSEADLLSPSLTYEDFYSTFSDADLLDYNNYVSYVESSPYDTSFKDHTPLVDPPSSSSTDFTVKMGFTESNFIGFYTLLSSKSAIQPDILVPTKIRTGDSRKAHEFRFHTGYLNILGSYVAKDLPQIISKSKLPLSSLKAFTEVLYGATVLEEHEEDIAVICPHVIYLLDKLSLSSSIFERRFKQLVTRELNLLPNLDLLVFLVEQCQRMPRLVQIVVNQLSSRLSPELLTRLEPIRTHVEPEYFENLILRLSGTPPPGTTIMNTSANYPDVRHLLMLRLHELALDLERDVSPGPPTIVQPEPVDSEWEARWTRDAKGQLEYVRGFSFEATQHDWPEFATLVSQLRGADWNLDVLNDWGVIISKKFAAVFVRWRRKSQQLWLRVRGPKTKSAELTELTTSLVNYILEWSPHVPRTSVSPTTSLIGSSSEPLATSPRKREKKPDLLARDLPETVMKNTPIRVFSKEGMKTDSALGYSNDHPVNLGEILDDQNLIPVSFKQMHVTMKQSSAISPTTTLEPTIGQYSVDDLRTEALLMYGLNHPNILKLHGLCYPSHRLPVLVCEPTGPSLETFLFAKNPRSTELTTDQQFEWALQLSRGLQYLHGLQPAVLHCDLSSSHIYLSQKLQPTSKDGAENSNGASAPVPSSPSTRRRTSVSTSSPITLPLLKIAGFGRSKRLLWTNKVRPGFSSKAASIRCFPPEYSPGDQCSAAFDVFMFGIVLFEVCTLQRFVTALSAVNNQSMPQELIKNGMRPEIPAELDPTLRSLISLCWSQEAGRPSFKQISSCLSSRIPITTVKPPTLAFGMGFEMFDSLNTVTNGLDSYFSFGGRGSTPNPLLRHQSSDLDSLNGSGELKLSQGSIATPPSSTPNSPAKTRSPLRSSKSNKEKSNKEKSILTSSMDRVAASPARSRDSSTRSPVRNHASSVGGGSSSLTSLPLADVANVARPQGSPSRRPSGSVVNKRRKKVTATLTKRPSKLTTLF